MTTYNTGEMSSMIAAMEQGANYPLDMVATIVADDYLAALDFEAIEAFAEKGLHDADREAIAETIETEGLGVTVAQVEAALVETCKARVELAD
jgi:hypothetical protein